MRGRIYRGKSADGAWHEGYLLRSPGVRESRPGEGWYINSADEKPYAHLVNPETVGIGTGQEDSNGVPVFENDIIETEYPENAIFVVRYGEYYEFGYKHLGFYAEYADGIERPNGFGYIQSGKVVGNLTDTPNMVKLIKGKDDAK